MTQCLLSHVLSDVYRIDQDRLETFYDDCLLKDQILDEYSQDQQEKQLEAREIRYFEQVQRKRICLLTKKKFLEISFFWCSVFVRRSDCQIYEIKFSIEQKPRKI